MAILVYRLTCAVTDKSYVGITARALDTRWLEHCARARQGIRNSRLYDAIRKYGHDAFTREIIATADTEDEARSLERHFIRELGTFENGYNANEGGCGWLIVPEEVKRKSAEKQRGKIIPQETRDRMSAAKKGRSECADHFGDHTRKGGLNPRASSYLMRFPDGSEEIVNGLRAFCECTGAHWQTLLRGQKSRGYEIMLRHGASTPPSADNALKIKEI